MPDVPEKSMDHATLTNLIGDALRAGIRDLKDTPVDLYQKVVAFPKEKGIESRLVAAPFYRGKSVWNKIDEIWKSDESAKLFEYLWENGAEKKQLSRDDDKEPTREAWERFVWGDLVHGPILYLMRKASNHQMSLQGKCTLWETTDNAIDAAVEDLADKLCGLDRNITAICPVLGLQIPDEIPFEIENGVRIVKWTKENRAVFITEHGNEFLSDDLSPFLGNAIYIENRFNLKNGETASKICLTLDRVKWACKVASCSDAFFQEGPVIIESPSGSHGNTIRRGNTGKHISSLGNAKITEAMANKMKEALNDLGKALNNAPELDIAMSYFGRSCNALLPRDILLDAAIGLEMLFVPDAGESTYKFRLHGTAILGSDVYKELGKIYSRRSKAAHGDMRKGKILAEDASRARYLLAKAIWSIAVMTNSNELEAKDNSIAEAIRELVKKRTAARNQM